MTILQCVSCSPSSTQPALYLFVVFLFVFFTFYYLDFIFYFCPHLHYVMWKWNHKALHLSEFTITSVIGKFQHTCVCACVCVCVFLSVLFSETQAELTNSHNIKML